MDTQLYYLNKLWNCQLLSNSKVIYWAHSCKAYQLQKCNKNLIAEKKKNPSLLHVVSILLWFHTDVRSRWGWGESLEMMEVQHTLTHVLFWAQQTLIHELVWKLIWHSMITVVQLADNNLTAPDWNVTSEIYVSVCSGALRGNGIYPKQRPGQ